jgi:hypothetical protein
MNLKNLKLIDIQPLKWEGVASRTPPHLVQNIRSTFLGQLPEHRVGLIIPNEIIMSTLPKGQDNPDTVTIFLTPLSLFRIKLGDTATCIN